MMTLRQRRLVERVARADSAGIASDALLDYLYGDDPDGGPYTARKSMHVQISRINQHLRPYGLEIRASHGDRWGCGVYRLELA